LNGGAGGSGESVAAMFPSALWICDMTSKRPLIGITLDSEEPIEDPDVRGYSSFPWYALRQNYAASIVEAGGLPLALPHEPEQVPEFLDLIDGLVITGGAFDVDPGLYGARSRHETVTTKDRRTAFEWALTKGAYERDMPILGICGGQQLVNVVFGGTLVQHIPDSVREALQHEQPNPRDEAGHDVVIETDSLLFEIVGKTRMEVNSAHHQAVDAVAPAFRVTARARDGVVEAIEDRQKRFCLGVQGHPEFLIDPGDRHILDAFIEASRKS
jgi:putative glutamine amidotransferase